MARRIDPLAAVANVETAPWEGKNDVLDRAALVVAGVIEELQTRADAVRVEPREVAILAVLELTSALLALNGIKNLGELIEFLWREAPERADEILMSAGGDILPLMPLATPLAAIAH
jgi:hypothetical protein